MYENMYWSSSLRPNVMVWLWMRHRQVSPWASSKLHGMGLKGGGLMGDDEKCSSRCLMGDNERVIPRDAFSRVGGGSCDRWLLIDDEDGMDEVEAP